MLAESAENQKQTIKAVVIKKFLILCEANKKVSKSRNK